MRKKIFSICFLLILIYCISSVCAADLNQTDDNIQINENIKLSSNDKLNEITTPLTEDNNGSGNTREINETANENCDILSASDTTDKLTSSINNDNPDFKKIPQINITKCFDYLKNRKNTKKVFLESYGQLTNENNNFDYYHIQHVADQLLRLNTDSDTIKSYSSMGVNLFGNYSTLTYNDLDVTEEDVYELMNYLMYWKLGYVFIEMMTCGILSSKSKIPHETPEKWSHSNKWVGFLFYNEMILLELKLFKYLHPKSTIKNSKEFEDIFSVEKHYKDFKNGKYMPEIKQFNPKEINGVPFISFIQLNGLVGRDFYELKCAMIDWWLTEFKLPTLDQLAAKK